MNLAFETLPYEIHYHLQDYLDVNSKIAIGQASSKLQNVYRPLSFRSCTVKLDPQISEKKHQERRLITCNMLKFPEKYSWFHSKRICRLFTSSLGEEESFWFLVFFWLQNCDFKSYYPLLSNIVFDLELISYAGYIMNRFPILYSSSFNSCRDRIPTISGIDLSICNSVSSSGNNGALSPLVYSFVSDAAVIQKTEFLPPFQHLSNLKTFTLRDDLAPDIFRKFISSISELCPTVKDIKTSHNFKADGSTLHVDECFQYLALLPSHVSSHIIIDKSIRTVPCSSYPPVAPQVKTIHMESKEFFVGWTCFFFHSSFPNLEAADMFELQNAIAKIPVLDSSLSFRSDPLLNFSNLKELSIDYSFYYFIEIADKFATAASYLKSLTHLSVSFRQIRTSVRHDLYITFYQILNTISDGTEIDGDKIYDIISQMTEKRQLRRKFSESEIKKITNIVLFPMNYPSKEQSPDSDWSVFLKNIHLSEFFIYTVAQLPSLEYLFLKKFHSSSVQLQLLIQNSETVKKVYFHQPKCTVWVERLGYTDIIYTPVSPYLYTPISHGEINIKDDWIVDVEQKRYSSALAHQKHTLDPLYLSILYNPEYYFFVHSIRFR